MIIYLVIVMTFSPIGEELFYRGVVHKTFSDKLGFWKFLPLASLIWIGSMFLICLVFNWIKRKSGSILGAVLTHAGFNAGMGLIFYYF